MKVSVIITAHNYGKYLPKAVGSVLNQTYDDYEIVIVNDGSTDDTVEILDNYKDIEKIKIVNLNGVGLAKAANSGIRSSNGKYIIRLDADDYFDENILLILSSVLDRNKEYGMVYPDYYRVNKYNEIIDQIRQQKVNDEVKLLDRNPLAAGAMFRRKCYDVIGGYNEELSYQEDYDFWLRFINNYHVYNVQLPLMYYRKHHSSMSNNTIERMKARQYVKHKFVARERNLREKRILCVLPMIAENRYKYKFPLMPLNGKPILAYVLEEANKCEIFDKVIVDTEDYEIAEEAMKYGVDKLILRPRHLAKLGIPPIEILKNLVKSIQREHQYVPDVILMVHCNNPFIKARHLEEAINTLLIYKCDSVISVAEDLKFHWQPGVNGLKPVVYPRKLLSDQKWMTYEEGGGIYALDVNNLKTDSFLGEKISFIEVNEVEAIRVDSDLNYWIADKILREDYCQ